MDRLSWCFCRKFNDDGVARELTNESGSRRLGLPRVLYFRYMWPWVVFFILPKRGKNDHVPIFYCWHYPATKCFFFFFSRDRNIVKLCEVDFVKICMVTRKWRWVLCCHFIVPRILKYDELLATYASKKSDITYRICQLFHCCCHFFIDDLPPFKFVFF